MSPDLELGVDTFGDVTNGPDGRPMTHAQVIRNVVEEAILADQVGQKTTGSFTVVARGEPGSAERLIADVRRAAQRAAGELPTARLVGVQPVSDAVVVANIVSNLEPADAKG